MKFQNKRQNRFMIFLFQKNINILLMIYLLANLMKMKMIIMFVASKKLSGGMQIWVSLLLLVYTIVLKLYV